MIDLSVYLNHVRVDPDTKLAYVGGGAVWKDVDEEGMKYGMATVGGTVNHTVRAPFVICPAAVLNPNRELADLYWAEASDISVGSMVLR